MPKKAKKTNVTKKSGAKPTAKRVTSKSKSAKTNARGTRYTPAQKAAVLNYVDEVNAKKGRGGAAAASRKYGISQITIGLWIKKGGKSSASKKSVAKGATRGRPKSSGKDFASKLRRLADIHEEITTTEAQLVSLKNEYEDLKKGL